MADITKCAAVGCPLKDVCYRYTVKNGHMQSIFMNVPYDHIKQKCNEYWGNGIVKTTTDESDYHA